MRKNKIVVFLNLLLFIFPAYTFAIELPKTGQTTCYDIQGVSIACGLTGQDDKVRAGISWLYWHCSYAYRQLACAF